MCSINFIPRYLLKRKKKMSTKTHTQNFIMGYFVIVKQANCGLSVVWNSRLQQETDDQCILHPV